MPGASCSVGSAREMTIGSALWYMPIHMCIWAWSCTHTHTHTHTASMLSWWPFFSLLCPDYPQSNLPALYQLYFHVAWPFVDYLFTPQLHPIRFQKLFLVVQSPTPALPCSVLRSSKALSLSFLICRMKLFWNLKLRSFQNHLRVSAVRSWPLGNHMGAVVAAGHQGDLSAPPASSRSELLGATCLAPSGLLEDQLCASLGSFCWVTSLSRFKVAMVRVFIDSLWKLTIHCPPPASLPLSMYQWPWAPVQLTPLIWIGLYRSSLLGLYLVVQWLWLFLPVQGTQVQSLIRKLKIAHAMSQLNQHATVTEHVHFGVCVPQLKLHIAKVKKKRKLISLYSSLHQVSTLGHFKIIAAFFLLNL